MPRKCSFPSTAQLERLLECLEERSYLATGYARTSHARDRTRAAWQDIALKLNSEGSGCIKTWQRWAKYWKDKKAAVKSKASKIRMARQRTGGGQSDNISLSVIEQRIVGLMSGTGFTSSDRELEIDPFHPSTVDPLHQITNHTQAENSVILNIEDDTHSKNDTPGSESIIKLDEAVATPPAAAIPSAVQLSHVASASSRRRPAANGRRHVTQRTPPVQRHSQMASLTERFLAIEEKRLENEVEISRNQKKMYELFLDIAKAMSNQTEAIKELCQAIRALAEKKS